MTIVSHHENVASIFILMEQYE